MHRADKDIVTRECTAVGEPPFPIVLLKAVIDNLGEDIYGRLSLEKLVVFARSPVVSSLDRLSSFLSSISVDAKRLKVA